MGRILVVGGSDAGISAALRIRELDPGREVTVALSDDYPNWSICGLPYFLSGETPDWRELAHRTTFPGIDVLQRHSVVRLDPDARSAVVVTPSSEFSLQYDKVILATGASPVVPNLPGANLDGAYLLHSMDDALRLDAVLRMEPLPRHVAIIGAGYIGVEMAEALVHRGVGVTLISRSDPPFPTMEATFGQAMTEEMRRHGVTVLPGASITRIERAASGIGLIAHGADGLSVPADLVLLAVGVRPNIDLAAKASVALGATGAIQVDATMRTNVPNVWAAGDCAETWHRLLRRDVYMSLGTIAHKQGRIAAEAALGGTRRFAGTVGTQVVKLFDLVAARTGLLEQEARANGFDALSCETELWDHKAYYPGASKLRVRVLGDRATGRLLGAQMLGHRHAEISKRIDVFATALFHGMTIEELNDLDLSYAPPFSSPWDPVQAAAQAWTTAVRVI